MSIIINGSGTITGASTLATAVVSPTLTTPVVTSTLGVGNATPSASGAGITFPATQSASSDANTLDDYEEGTWTPIITPSTGGSITLTGTVARYTKVGRVVYLWFTAQVGAKSSPSGRVGITGLPFSNTSGQPVAATAFVNSWNAFTGVCSCLIESSSSANIDRYNNGAISVDLASYAAVSGYIFFSATFEV